VVGAGFENEIISMRVLLFGKSGQLGRELQRTLVSLGELVSFGHEESADFTKLENLAATVRSIRPDIIVNAAAYTAVDNAEDEPSLAQLINAEAPRVLAHEAAKLGSWLMHYSTEYVFDGSGTAAWLESDQPSPLNVYGESKWAGEKAIQSSGCQHLIFRTSWVHSANGRNFIKTILRLAGERETLSVVSDQAGAPTGAELLAEVTTDALAMALNNEKLSGLYHVAASGVTSWYDYACFVVEYARQQGTNLKAKSIHPVHSTDFAVKARRPLNSRLDTDKFRRTFNSALPDWKQGVERTLHEILGKPAH
jgi:dTDP-4-dehydrorhamnose reductase